MKRFTFLFVTTILFCLVTFCKSDTAKPNRDTCVVDHALKLSWYSSYTEAKAAAVIAKKSLLVGYLEKEPLRALLEKTLQ